MLNPPLYVGTLYSREGEGGEREGGGGGGGGGQLSHKMMSYLVK